MTTDKTIRIIVNWENLESITNAEKKTIELENAGYKLIKTISGFSTSESVYIK
jgi:hypothetical protein